MYILGNDESEGYLWNTYTNRLTGDIREVASFSFQTGLPINDFFIFKITGAMNKFISPFSGFLGVAPVDKFDKDPRH